MFPSTRIGIATLVLILASCGSGGAGVKSGPTPPTPPSPPSPPACASRDTASYLGAAIRASSFFRWTEVKGQSSIYLYFYVDDTGVPSAERESFSSEFAVARDVWKSALRAAGVKMESVTRWKSKGGSLFTEQTCFVTVSYQNTLPENQLGRAGFTGLIGNKVQGFTVELALCKPASTQRLTANERLSVLIHELGHVYGIYDPTSREAHSPNECDVMYPVSKHFWTSLSAGDTATILALYRATPTLVRKDAAQ